MKSIIQALHRHKLPLIILLLTWGLFFSVLFAQMLQEKADGLWAGHEHVWSDWALHISMANTFAYKSPSTWFDYHPLYADGKFTYPFLTNFISGMLMRAGMPLTLAFAVPSITFILLLLVGAYFFFFQIFKSRWLPIIAISIFLFSSGLGFIDFAKDFYASPSWELITYPPKDYSRNEPYEWYAGNVAVGLLVPQRAFLLGMTIGIWAINLLMWGLWKNKKETIARTTKIQLAGAGVLAGLLPITHAHGFIAIVIITGFLCLARYRKWRLLIWYAVPAALLSSTLYMTFIYGGIENTNFISWLPGWTSKDGFFGWLKMWIALWGLALPLTLAGYIMIFRKSNRFLYKSIFIAGAVIFASANLFNFQPVHWDNSKLFSWAYFIFSGLMAYVICKLWNTAQLYKKTIAVVFCCALVATGVLEIIRLGNVSRHSFMMTNSADIALGLKIRSETSPTDRFLTAPTHNHFVMMWGLRPILIGFTPWVWNYGFNSSGTELDMRTIYLGGEAAIQLLKKHRISYVTIGPTEIYDLSANENFFASRFPLAFSNENYRVYSVKSALSPTNMPR